MSRCETWFYWRSGHIYGSWNEEIFIHLSQVMFDVEQSECSAITRLRIDGSYVQFKSSHQSSTPKQIFRVNYLQKESLFRWCATAGPEVLSPHSSGRIPTLASGTSGPGFVLQSTPLDKRAAALPKAKVMSLKRQCECTIVTQHAARPYRSLWLFPSEFIF